MIYSSDITGKMVREAIKSIPTNNLKYDSNIVSGDYTFELMFKAGWMSETSKGDFALVVDQDRIETRVILRSQMSHYTDDWTEKEWKLSEMVSKDWRFIEDKIRRAQKRVASKNRQNWMIGEAHLSLWFAKWNKEERTYQDII